VCICVCVCVYLHGLCVYLCVCVGGCTIVHVHGDIILYKMYVYHNQYGVFTHLYSQVTALPSVLIFCNTLL